MNEVIPENYFKHSGIAYTKLAQIIVLAPKKLLSLIGKGLMAGGKRIWRYLKEQNDLAGEHHRALRSVKDEFYSKNYWAIR